ncbi:MAG: DNA replication/repair protein RecF [Verrucomicrobia bacterium]|nr:DNA replication/repair protein RecF [Verrucomicrobiota bacterium]
MHLNRLLLRNFRNYAQSEVVFSPSVNLIQGENGQGKTNLLEAIHFVSTGRSFRATALSDLIAFGQTYFYLEAEFFKDGVTQSVKVYYDESTRKVQYNETVHATLTSLLGILPSVLLSPDDLSLVSGTPAERRRFLDMHIAQTDPLYVNHLGRYFKAMKQRNHLLRTKSEASIQAWEQMMAQSASYLVHKRRLAAAQLRSPSSDWMQVLSRGQDRIDIQYHSSLALPSEEHTAAVHFQQVWQKMRPKEMLLGSTLTGPHRDDLLIHLSDKPAKVFSSEGQKRSCISSLRFAQWVQMEQVLGHPPLLGIDDFGIQLDIERQMQLKAHLPKFKQVFLTSPFALQNDFREGTPLRVLTIKKGCVISS